MKGKFDLIVFDWDGTLMDSVDWIVQCLIVAAKEQGCIVPVEQNIRDIIGLSIHKSLDRLFPTLDKPARKDFIESYSRAFFSRKITEQDFNVLLLVMAISF